MDYACNKATAEEIREHLKQCDLHFVPSLSSRVNLMEYAEKLSARAYRWEAWEGNSLVGLVAAYLDGSEENAAFISNVSVLPAFARRGIAKELLEKCEATAKQHGRSRLQLEVDRANSTARQLYAQLAFSEKPGNHDPVIMFKTL